MILFLCSRSKTPRAHSHLQYIFSSSSVGLHLLRFLAESSLFSFSSRQFSTYIIRFRSYLRRFTHSLRLAHSDGESSSNQFRRHVVVSGSKSGCITLFPSLSSFVTPTCGRLRSYTNQSNRNALFNRNKNPRMTGFLENKFVQLRPCFAEAIKPVAIDKLVEVLQHQNQQNFNNFINTVCPISCSGVHAIETLKGLPDLKSVLFCFSDTMRSDCCGYTLYYVTAGLNHEFGCDRTFIDQISQEYVCASQNVLTS